MNIGPMQELWDEEKNNDKKSQGKRIGNTISNNSAIARIKDTEIENDRSMEIRKRMPDEIKDTEVLDYSGQLRYFAKRYWYITILILGFLALWILFLTEVSMAISIIKGYLVIPVVIIWLIISSLGLYVIFIKTLYEVPKNNNAVLLLKGKPQPDIVAAEGWAFALLYKKLIAWDALSLVPVPIDDTIANVATGSGASIDELDYSFVVAPIPRSLFALRKREGMEAVVNSFDNDVKLGIRQVVGYTPLGTTQRLPDSLLIEITAAILDKLAPNTWYIHNIQNKGDAFLISLDNPIFLYGYGVAIFALRVSNAKAPKLIIDAENKIAAEGYERVSDLENTVTRVLEVGRYMEGLQAFGGDPDPESVGDMMQEAENLKNGAFTITGLAKLAGSVAKRIKPKEETEKVDKVDISKAIKEIRRKSNEEREDLLNEAQNRLGATNKKEEGDNKK